MLYLASRSPRRNQLLARLGRPFQALDLEVVEQRAASESAQDYVCRVAADKARAGLARVLADDPQARVLGSDTEVVLDGEVFGKPADAAEALLPPPARSFSLPNWACAGIDRVAAAMATTRAVLRIMEDSFGRDGRDAARGSNGWRWSAHR